nr:hypothetical protein [uncultured Kiloniella sp.]
MRLRAAFLTARGVYFFGALFFLSKVLNNYSLNEIIERVPTFVLEPIPMFIYFWYETPLEGGIMGSMILIFWSITVTLIMDTFWIRSTIKWQRKQENSTQQQVEAFD